MVKKPNSRRNLDMAIRRAFGDDRFVQMRTLIANTIVARMLPDGVIKGGSGLKMRLGTRVLALLPISIPPPRPLRRPMPRGLRSPSKRAGRALLASWWLWSQRIPKLYLPSM